MYTLRLNLNLLGDSWVRGYFSSIEEIYAFLVKNKYYVKRSNRKAQSIRMIKTLLSNNKYVGIYNSIGWSIGSVRKIYCIDGAPENIGRGDKSRKSCDGCGEEFDVWNSIVFKRSKLCHLCAGCNEEIKVDASPLISKQRSYHEKD